MKDEVGARIDRLILRRALIGVVVALVVGVTLFLLSAHRMPV